MYQRKSISEMNYDSIDRGKMQDIRVEKVDQNLALAYNYEKNTEYEITLDGEIVTNCNCPHKKYRNINYCKHMVATALQLKLCLIDFGWL